MMRRFLGNRFAFAAAVLALASAQGWNVQQGRELRIPGHRSLVPQPTLVAHGPMIPPDPWAGGNPATLIAHGPMIPPDPWAGGNLSMGIA